MRNLSLRFIKCVIGLSVALIAVSNCFNVLSNSPRLPADDTSQTAVATTNQFNSNFSAPRSIVNRLFEPDRESVIGARAELATRASALSPFAPNITATKSHTPPGSANPGDTLTYTVVISNSGTSDATGVNFTDTIDPNTTLVPGSVKASPIAVDDNYHTIGNVNISVPAAQGVVANDSNSGFGTLSVTKVNATTVPGTASTANGSVTMNSDGSFSYTPNVAFRGPSDSFTYTLDNGSGSTDTATVTIAVNGLIWFVNAAAAPGGDGRLSTPFNCLVGPGCFDPVAVDIANDNIFVYTGAYTGGLTLLGGQKLIGQGAGDTLINITALTQPSGTNLLPSTGGTPPTIAAAGANITLGSGNTIRGVTLNGTAPSAVDLTGTGFGTATIAETALGGIGQALNLNSGTLTGPVAATAAFTSISSTSSSTTGVSLTGVAGNMSSGSTSITSPTGIGLSVATSSAALDFGNTSSTLSGGTGVSLLTNTGTITFGTLTITPAAGQRGLLATNNTMTITATGGAISTTTATAVEITRTTSTTPLVMSLTSVSSAGGTANGIILQNTSGSFTITGSGTPASGGTIASKTGADGSTTQGSGIFLSGVSNISLAWMQLNSFQNFAIRGLNVTGFTLSNTIINGANGTSSAGGSEEGAIRFDGLFGSASITDSTVGGTGAGDTSFSDDLRVTNGSGTLNRLTITNTNFGKIGVSGNNGITFIANTGAVMNLTLQDSFLTNAIGSLARINANNNSSMDLVIRRNKFSNNNPNAAGGSGGLAITGDSAGSLFATVTYDVSCNTFRDAIGIALLVGKGNGKGSFTGSIINNRVGVTGVADSGSAQAAGIKITSNGTGTHTVMIANNDVRQTNEEGIYLQANDSQLVANGGGQGVMNATVFGNTVAEPGAFSFAGLNVDVGALGSDNNRVNIVVGSATNAAQKNDFSTGDPFDFSDVNFSTTGSTVINLSKNGSVSSTVDQVIKDDNLNPATTDVFFFGTINLVNTLPATPPAVAACVQPASVGRVVTERRSDRTEGDDTVDAVLLAARGENPKDDSVRNLTDVELANLVQAAIERWRAAGIPSEDIDRMQAARFEITDLPEGQIASVRSSHIKIDETGAGYGWYVDRFPAEDSEFDVMVPGRELQTTELSPAVGRMDLLTVVMRELGIVYMQGKNRVPNQLRNLLEPTLSPAVRRMPELNVPDRSKSSLSGSTGSGGVALSAPPLVRTVSFTPIPAVFNPSAELRSDSYGRNTRRVSYAAGARSVAPRSPAPFSGETVNLSIGTIPAGKSVTITFQVTVNNPFPNGVCNVTNQGHVTGSNFSQVDTNSDVTPINKAVTISPCPANITKSTDPGVCTAVATFTTPTGDGCPAPTVTCTPASGSAFPKGTTTVTCTASNGNPPNAVCTFTVTVNDSQPPTITCPANVTQGTDPGVCTAVVTYANATASDNCPGVGTPVCTPASGSTFNKGTTTVNCTVSDASSNSANCSFTVTVNDTTAPSITCPASVTQSTDPNQCSAVVTYPNATATDNCPGVGTPVCTPASGSTFAKGTTTVNCTVSDASGNPASCSFTVTVNDTQAPSITCPANVTHGTDANQCSAVVTYSNATATDNCPGVGTPVCTPASGTTFAKGTTTVNCTVSDASGNPASCSFTVTVNDTQAPSITCPSSVTQGTDPNQCSAVVTYPNATATDNCPGVGPPVCSPSSGSTFPKGTTTVNCTVSDASSNSASCSFTVTVNDTTPPTITCPANVVKSTDPNKCTAVVTYPNATASDACSGVGTPVCSPSSGSTFAIGVTTVTCTVSDASGNPASCSFTVTVRDTQAPTMTACPSNINVTSGGGCQVVNYTSPTATDNCGSAAVVCSPASGTCFPPGTTPVTCTASDTSPDSPDSSCSFTVTVVPCAITCPSNISVGNDPGQCGAVVTYAPATNGGCGTIVCSPSSGSFFPVGTTTVICTTTAGPGCSFTVTVADTEPPVITCPPNVSVSASSFPQCTATVNPGTATATDNCGVASVVGTRSDGHALTDPYPPGTTTITWTATDTSGHTASCTQTVTVTNDVSIASNFNGTAVGAGNYIWFNSVLDVSGLGSSPVTIRFFNQKVTSASFTLTVPDAVVTFDPLATTATTTFSGGQWVTHVPSSGLAGNTFLSGLAYQLPGNLPGGLNPVTWSGTFVSDTAGVQVKWKWAAAAYSHFSSNYNLLGVKPVDDNHASQYQNSDHAGTPENFKAYVIGGARGGGGSNYTGSYSGTKSVTPCVE